MCDSGVCVCVCVCVCVAWWLALHLLQVQIWLGASPLDKMCGDPHLSNSWSSSILQNPSSGSPVYPRQLELQCPSEYPGVPHMYLAADPVSLSRPPTFVSFRITSMCVSGVCLCVFVCVCVCVCVCLCCMVAGASFISQANLAGASPLDTICRDPYLSHSWSSSILQNPSSGSPVYTRQLEFQYFSESLGIPHMYLAADLVSFIRIPTFGTPSIYPYYVGALAFLGIRCFLLLH